MTIRDLSDYFLFNWVLGGRGGGGGGKRLLAFYNVYEMIHANWVSEWLLLKTKWAFFQPYHGENKLHFDAMMMLMMTALY